MYLLRGREFQRQMWPSATDTQTNRAGSLHLLETAVMCARSYLTGGERGEKTRSDGNGGGVHTFGTRGRGTLTTTARKNQNGIKKRKRRPTTG
jgi:hypothetical protein